VYAESFCCRLNIGYKHKQKRNRKDSTDTPFRGSLSSLRIAIRRPARMKWRRLRTDLVIATEPHQGYQNRLSNFPYYVLSTFRKICYS
jgi:hypothetical protein